MSNLFRLISTYEYFVEIKSTKRSVRIEIFTSLDNDGMFKGRVWIQNIYNLYPSLLNSDKAGKDLHAVHSADELNVDISSTIVDDERYLFGIKCNGEKEILNYFEKRISDYARTVA